jgi:transcriptional regulator with XRE-family HTH domain
MTKEELKQFREALELSQQKISLLLGIQQSAYCMYETGEREIPRYIGREISFFSRLSQREKDKDLKQLEA